MIYYINLPEDFDTETFLDTLHISGIYFKAIPGTYTTRNLKTKFNYKFIDLDIEKYMSIISRVARSEELPIVIFSTGDEDSESISINIYSYNSNCNFNLNIDSNNIENCVPGYMYSIVLKDHIDRINNSGEWLDHITIVDPTAIVVNSSGICSSRGRLNSLVNNKKSNN